MRIVLVVTILLLSCGVGICAESDANKKNHGNNTQQITENTKSRINQPIGPPATLGNPEKKFHNISAVCCNRKTNSEEGKWYDVMDKNRFLLCIAALQLWVFWIQARRLRETVEATKEAAEAAKTSADVAENALTMVERPYIFVSCVSEFQFDSEKGYFVTYEVSNHGRTPADIDTVQTIMSTIESDIIYPGLVESDHVLYLSPILEPQGKATNLRQYFPATEQGIVNPESLSDDILLRIIITYRGVIKEIYEDSFFWWYDRSVKRFVPRKEADYYYKKKYSVQNMTS